MGWIIIKSYNQFKLMINNSKNNNFRKARLGRE